MVSWGKYHDFGAEEFFCKCGCGEHNVSEELVDMLQKARNISRNITSEESADCNGVPFRIARGCSCAKHNATIPNYSPTSSHIASDNKECTAVDLKCKNASERFIIIKSLILAGFKRIGVYNSHNGIHTDCDETKAQGVMWKK